MRVYAHVVVGNCENFPLGGTDSGVQRCGTSLFFFEDVAQGNGKRLDAFYDLAGVIGRVVVDDDDFPGFVCLQFLQAFECSG